MSRPEIPIDWKRVDELLEAGCLGTEVAAYFSMHPNTFYDRVVAKYNMSFTEYSTQKKSCGDALIREGQFRKALKRLDNTMLIWLGKQRLNQKESLPETSGTDEINKQYLEVMHQLVNLQSERKIADSNINSEAKS